MRLRVMDIDFGYSQIVIHQGKGKKDRMVPLPEKLVVPLREHLEKVQQLHDQDLAAGYGEVFLPGALARKYPGAAKQWRWQYVFPSGKLSVDPRTGITRRHHLHESTMRKAISHAARQAGMVKRVTTHTLDTVLQHISWPMAMTSEQCRNYWGMRMWQRRRSTRMC